MPPAHALTISALANAPSLRLTLVSTGSRGGSSRVKSAHASDLDHPGRYVLPGELVLTNGLWLGRVGVGTWVGEIAAAGAAGVGFGLSSGRPVIPPELVEACERRGVALVAVPEEVSFAAVSEHVQERTASDGGALLRRQLERVRQVAQATVGSGGRGALLALLRDETGLLGAFVSSAGAILASTFERIPADVVAEASRAATAGTHPRPLADGWMAFGPPGRRSRSTLVVAARVSEIDDEARLLVEQIAVFIAFEDARADGVADASRALAQELVALLGRNAVEPAELGRRLAAIGLDPVHAVVAICLAASADDVQHAAGHAALRCAVADLGDVRLVLAQDDGRDLAVALAGALAVVGVDRPAVGHAEAARGPAALRAAIDGALVACRLAAKAPGTVVAAGDVASAAMLLRLLSPRALTAYRDAILGAVEAWDREHRTELVHTLRVFLDSGGRWQEAAERLHVHQNTLRYRLERIERLTGRRLADTADRVDLFLAVNAPGNTS